MAQMQCQALPGPALQGNLCQRLYIYASLILLCMGLSTMHSWWNKSFFLNKRANLQMVVIVFMLLLLESPVPAETCL